MFLKFMNIPIAFFTRQSFFQIKSPYNKLFFVPKQTENVALNKKKIKIAEDRKHFKLTHNYK